MKISNIKTATSIMELNLDNQHNINNNLEQKRANLNSLSFNTFDNKGIVSVSCPIFFQDSEQLFLAIFSYFSIIKYQFNTSNIKDKLLEI